MSVARNSLRKWTAGLTSALAVAAEYSVKRLVDSCTSIAALLASRDGDRAGGAASRCVRAEDPRPLAWSSSSIKVAEAKRCLMEMGGGLIRHANRGVARICRWHRWHARTHPVRSVRRVSSRVACETSAWLGEEYTGASEAALSGAPPGAIAKRASSTRAHGERSMRLGDGRTATVGCTCRPLRHATIRRQRRSSADGVHDPVGRGVGTPRL